MNNTHHIHEVLGMLYNTDKKYTISSLLSELQNIFGTEAQFTSCSENIFSLNEVIDFLLSRGKIRLDGDAIIPLTPACSH